MAQTKHYVVRSLQMFVGVSGSVIRSAKEEYTREAFEKFKKIQMQFANGTLEELSFCGDYPYGPMSFSIHSIDFIGVRFLDARDEHIHYNPESEE